MHPVLILSYNNLPALKACIASVEAQDVETFITVLDNGSTDGSQEWLASQHQSGLFCLQSETNKGVSAGWNIGLKSLFKLGVDSVLVLNQDTVLPSFFYSLLLDCNLPFVTGRPAEAPPERDEYDRDPKELFNSPCFSAFLIRRDCWETVGEFDARMFGWASDNDYHVRAHLLGINLQMANAPFHHRAGTTMRTAPPVERRWFSERANADRAVFKSIYGCEPGEPGYADLFDPALFGVRRGIHSR